MRHGYRWLSTWPLLIAAIVAFTAGTRLLADPPAKELAAAVLLAMGAVLLGAWISMLAAHDYPGREPGKEEEEKTDDQS